MSAAAASFEWQVPTRAVFGASRVGEVGIEAAALGSRAAVFLDRIVSTQPVAGRVLASLRAHGVHVSTLVTVDGPPYRSELQDRVRQAGRAESDLVVAVGGGSTMDAAKIVALAVTNPGLLDSSTIADGRVTNLDAPDRTRCRPGLPTLVVPTTAATGSELNTVAALTHGGHKHLVVSGLLAPSTAILDPHLTGTLSGHQLAEGGIETFARIISPYLVAGEVLPSTDAMAELLAARCLTTTDAARRRPDDLDARTDLTWVVGVSATQLVGLGRADWSHVLWYLQDAVAEVAGTGKAPAMSALLPAYLAEIGSGSRLGRQFGSAARLDRLADALEPALPGAAGHVVGALTTLLADWGLPTGLDDLGLTDTDLARVVDLTMAAWGTSGRLDGVSRDDLTSFHTRARTTTVLPKNRPRTSGPDRSISIVEGGES